MSNHPGYVPTKLQDAINWAQKYSLFTYPFATACCAMEFMATMAGKYDIARFGAEFPRFSPRQADLLLVVGTISAQAYAEYRKDQETAAWATPTLDPPYYQWRPKRGLYSCFLSHFKKEAGMDARYLSDIMRRVACPNAASLRFACLQ